MSYPDVVIACIEHKVSLEAFRAIEAALVKHDNNMKDYSLVVDWSCRNNHSNGLNADRANTQSSLCESGKTATQLLQCLWLSEFTISSCSEGRTRDVHSSSLLIDVYALFLTLVSDGRLQWLSWEIPGPFLLRERCNLFNHLGTGKRIIWLLFCGFCSSLTWGCPVFSVAGLLSEVVFTLSWCRSINTIPAS